MGCANPEGATGANIARQIALRAGLPITTSGVTVNRFCSSGCRPSRWRPSASSPAKATCSRGWCRTASLRAERGQQAHARRSVLVEHKPEIYWNMLQTAEQVAKRYNIPRERMDQYGAQSQQRATAELEAGKFKDEIVSVTTTAGVADPVMGLRTKEVTISNDEGIRPGTTFEAVSGIRPLCGWCDCCRQRQPVQRRRRRLRADDESSPSKGLEAARPFPRFAGGGLRARRDGHRPGLRRAKVLKRLGLTVATSTCGAHEAFAVQVLYCADSSASRWTASTSTAARSPSATPTACRASASRAMR